MLRATRDSDWDRPQLEVNAIKHLCHSLSISIVFVDNRHHEAINGLNDGITVVNLSTVLASRQATNTDQVSRSRTVQSHDLAYLFHTSGTSSGLPKSIPQTHYAAVGVLPSFGSEMSKASFSTTPLYHGGIADCLRAWTSGAAVHLFSGTRPITSKNILEAIKDADNYAHGAYRPRYFTSVPYILQMLVTDSSPPETHEGLKMLQRMELVGVGGAALPTSLGDDLVSKGVKLVSRFGSAECGFLLSSHRNYKTDLEWSWLRADPALQPDLYDFEPQALSRDVDSPALFEFVVKPKWPHRGKTNRPDGSFATADLFERHPSIPNAWRYHSRADAQITLSNGKKFDPAPIEGELLASDAGQKLLTDVMIFGTGREAPGLLLLPRERAEVIEEIWPTVEMMNEKAQSHARIGREMIIVSRMDSSHEVTLPKSSKGTILRRQAESLFSDKINNVYGSNETAKECDREEVADGEVSMEIQKIIAGVLGRHVDPKVDLFSQGVDSIACARVRKKISQRLLPASHQALPMNVIYDHGSIENLVTYIIRLRHPASADSSGPPSGSTGHDKQKKEMLNLVQEYGHTMKMPTKPFDLQQHRVVVLTGATGFLGAHILDILLSDPNITKVYCLVRAADVSDARKRVEQSLKERELSVWARLLRDCPSLVCLPAKLDEERLGLDDDTWDKMSKEATMIIHSAWPVNFALQLISFEKQFAGLRNLLRLRDATKDSSARFVFVSSIAAVSEAENDGKPISESLSSDPSDASPLGYSRSKWVAEQICASTLDDPNPFEPARDPVSSTGGKGVDVPIIIVRVGQLCANSSGVWNKLEAYPLVLSTAKLTGCLPALDEPLSWLPVHQAAKAIIEISTAAKCEYADGSDSCFPVYHVLNRHRTPTWADMIQRVLRQAGNGSREAEDLVMTGIEIVNPARWLRRLETALESVDHPARSLLPLWKSVYSGDRAITGGDFSVAHAELVSHAMRGVSPLSESAVTQMWIWIENLNLTGQTSPSHPGVSTT